MTETEELIVGPYHRSEYLNPQERQDLTGYMQSRAQSRWLKSRGVPHHLDPGRVIVSRIQVREWIEGEAREQAFAGHNWTVKD